MGWLSVLLLLVVIATVGVGVLSYHFSDNEPTGTSGAHPGLARSQRGKSCADGPTGGGSKIKLDKNPLIAIGFSCGKLLTGGLVGMVIMD